jgi:hypothetical protein
MNKWYQSLFKWHIASHRDRAWKRVVAACQGEDVESEGTVWRYCELSQVETTLTIDQLSRYLASEFTHHWEPHSESTGYVRVDEFPALPEEDDKNTNERPCARGKCPCCMRTGSTRGCWCSLN